MTTIRLPYIKSYEDRHGKRRYYFRRPGSPSVALPGDPTTREFREAYEAAQLGQPIEIGSERNKPGSFSALIALYYRTGAYKNLQPITRKTYRNDMERFRKKHGEMSVKAIQRRHISAMLDAIEAEGKSPKSLRRVLGVLLTLAHERGWRPDNPMTGLRRGRKASKGFRAWTEADIARWGRAYAETDPRARLALALLLHTAQRRSDVVRMGWADVQDGALLVAQSKSGGATQLRIPIHPTLQAELDRIPQDQPTFLRTQYGEAFSPAGFTNWFSERARAAGLPDGSTPHGLRKAAAVRLAEAGCSASQIMAITGHKNLSEVTLYTASADQARLAREAMEMARLSQNPSNLGREGGQSEEKGE